MHVPLPMTAPRAEAAVTIPDAARSVQAAADLKNLQQLVYLRWTAVFGQVVTIEAAHFALGLAVLLCSTCALAQACLPQILSIQSAKAAGQGPPPIASAVRDWHNVTLPDHWLMFIAEREGVPIASSLIGIDTERGVAYGRYWGALERVDCLHFEACYYQPIQWCIAHRFRRFEGGAQGEHKMARALLPVRTTSAHWLAHPAFADAVERFLEREGSGVDDYLRELAQRSPLKTKA